MTDPGAELPPPPPELLDFLRLIEAYDDVPADIRGNLRVFRESLAAGRRPPPPSGSAVGSWGFTGRAEGRAGLSGSGDLRDAADAVRKSPRVKEWFHAALSEGLDVAWKALIAWAIEAGIGAGIDGVTGLFGSYFALKKSPGG